MSFSNDERARQRICTHSVSVRHTQLENVHLFEKRVRLGARSHSTYIISSLQTKIVRPQHIIFLHETSGRWGLKRRLFDTSTFVDHCERVETWIATMLQNEFDSRRGFKSWSKIRPHKLKKNHQNWHPNRWVGFFCRNFDLVFLDFVCLRSVAKLAIWKFLNNELAHYFRFFNHLKEMKACFQS